MITFREVKVKVEETYKDKTPGFRYGVIMFYSLLSAALVGVIEQLVQIENMNGITKADRNALILWMQREVRKPVLVKFGFTDDEIDEDILESRILASGRELTEQ